MDRTERAHLWDFYCTSSRVTGHRLPWLRERRCWSLQGQGCTYFVRSTGSRMGVSSFLTSRGGGNDILGWMRSGVVPCYFSFAGWWPSWQGPGWGRTGMKEKRKR